LTNGLGRDVGTDFISLGTPGSKTIVVSFVNTIQGT
jgi:hypothetical protein